jgi:hypothetical protein
MEQALYPRPFPVIYASKAAWINDFQFRFAGHIQRLPTRDSQTWPITTLPQNEISDKPLTMQAANQ